MEGSKGEGPKGFSLLELQQGGLRVPSGVMLHRSSVSQDRSPLSTFRIPQVPAHLEFGHSLVLVHELMVISSLVSYFLLSKA